MVSFLFWNLKRLPRQDVVARLAQRHNVDILLLAECAVTDDQIIAAIKRGTGKVFRKSSNVPSKVQVFTHFSRDELRCVFDDVSQRLTIQRLIIGSQDILLAAVHFQSRVNWSREDQTEEAGNLVRDIIRIEDDYGHRRTVLVGDLNMNPFDFGMTSSHSLHAVMTRKIAKQRSRTVAKRDHHFFYNPMWGFFGDRTPGPPGTHYYRAAKPIMYFWNMFDQVLIRPDLLDHFHDDVKILDSDGINSLLTKNGLPNQESGSDHLPLLFSLEL